MSVFKYKFKKVIMKSNLKQFFCLMFFLLIFLSFSSCSKDNNAANVKAEEVLPVTFKDIEPYVSLHGDTNSDTVIINIQGGPILSLDEEGLDTYIKGSHTENVLYVNVHQAQTLTPSLFKKKINLEDAEKYTKESVAMLKMVMDYYLFETNKSVYFLGISYGAFLLQELIKDNGLPYVDGCLVVGARLKMDNKALEILSKGFIPKYKFDSNGKFSIDVLVQKSEMSDIVLYNMSMLGYVVAKNDYTESLSFIKTLSRTTFIYGERDNFIGPLSHKEIDFLKKRKANVICTLMGNHRFTVHKSLLRIKDVFKLK